MVSPLTQASGRRPFHRATLGGVVPAFWEPPVVYYMGIIDMLQRWDTSKRAERAAKLALCRDGNGLSAIEPIAYRSRFEEQVVYLVAFGRPTAQPLSPV